MKKESTYWDAIAILIVYSLLSTPGSDDRQKTMFSVYTKWRHTQSSITRISQTQVEHFFCEVTCP